MGQSEIIEKLEELNANSVEKGLTAAELRVELGKPKASFYRSLTAALNGKRIKKERNKYFMV